MALRILLMTATIAPARDTFLLKVTDPAERLEQYRQALAFYLAQVQAGVFDRIVFVDNSGHSLESLRAVAEGSGEGARVEFVSYVSEIEPAFSRYYLEINLIARAMAQSAFLNLEADAVIWKATGRYIIRNIADIVGATRPGFDLLVNLRNHPERALDFYLAAFPRRRFDDHLGRDPGDYRCIQHGEIILRDKIEAGAFGDLRIEKRFARTPRIEGVRGFDGARYGGLADTVKYYLRAAANRALPGLWV